MSTLDTVRFEIFGRWKACAGLFVQSVVHRSETGLDGKETRRMSRFLNNEVTGLRVGGSIEAPEFCEVSLPRLFYGNNGKLLRPADLPDAMRKLQDMVSAAVDNLTLERLSRADLTLHLPVRASESVAALRGTRHPAVRSMPREFFGTGLEWVGSQVVIRLYDKGMEMNGVTADIMRLEFQFRSKALGKRAPLFYGGVFNLDHVREVYRNEVSRFQPRKLDRPGCVVEFLGMLYRDQLAFPDGRLACDVFLDMKGSPRYKNDLRRRMLRCRPPVFVLDLLQFVPEVGWPEFLDVTEESVPQERIA